MQNELKVKQLLMQEKSVDCSCKKSHWVIPYLDFIYISFSCSELCVSQLICQEYEIANIFQEYEIMILFALLSNVLSSRISLYIFFWIAQFAIYMSPS
jgi:hypothetical protein